MSTENFKIEFVVSGSTGNQYLINISNNGDDWVAICTCPAGQRAKLCRHVRAVVSGNYDDVLNKTDTTEFEKRFAQSTVAAAIVALEHAEDAEVKAKSTTAMHKKRLSKLLIG